MVEKNYKATSANYVFYFFIKPISEAFEFILLILLLFTQSRFHIAPSLI